MSRSSDTAQKAAENPGALSPAEREFAGLGRKEPRAFRDAASLLWAWEGSGDRIAEASQALADAVAEQEELADRVKAVLRKHGILETAGRGYYLSGDSIRCQPCGYAGGLKLDEPAAAAPAPDVFPAPDTVEAAEFGPGADPDDEDDDLDELAD